MVKKFKVFDTVVLGDNLSAFVSLHLLRSNGRKAYLLSDRKDSMHKSIINENLYFAETKDNKKLLKKLFGARPKKKQYNIAFAVGENILNPRNLNNYGGSSFNIEYSKQVDSLSYDSLFINKACSKGTTKHNVFDIKHIEVYDKLVEMYKDFVLRGDILNIDISKGTVSFLENLGEESQIIVCDNLINSLSLDRFLKYSKVSFPNKLERKETREIFVDDIVLFNDIDILFAVNKMYNKIIKLKNGALYEFVEKVKLEDIRSFLPFAKNMNVVKYGILKDYELNFVPVKKIGDNVRCIGRRGMWNNNVTIEMDIKTINQFLKENQNG